MVGVQAQGRKIGTAGPHMSTTLPSMTSAAARERTRQDYQERILRVLVHLERHLDETLHLDDLAGLAGWSPCHFHRIFTGLVGETVADHVRRVRLERAALAMRGHGASASVLRIALDAGYQDHSAFARAFRQRFGCTPSAWRRRPRQLPATADHRRLLPFGHPESTMDIQIRTLDPLRVAFVRHLGPYQECGGAWQQLIGWAGPRGLLGADAVCLGVGHDDPSVTEPARIRYDACIVVPDGTPVEGGIGIQILPGGEHAVTLHRGPYELLPAVYLEVIGRWIPSQGRTIARERSSPYEIYRNDMRTTPPADLLTEVRVPLA
jgi:AraC family transcriptional regulator